MEKNNPTLRTTIEGEEHRPGYALNNARAFVEMAESAADVFGFDYDDLRVENDCSGHGFEGHYFVFEHDGELSTEPVYNSPEEFNENRGWETDMPLSDFEDTLESIASDSEKSLYGLSRGIDYRLKSSSPPGMMEGFGGPRLVPGSYGDALMHLSDENNDFRTLFLGAPNSGAQMDASFVERTVAGLKSKLSCKSKDDILIESHQSGREPYAELKFIEGDEWEDGMGTVERETAELIAENAEGFEVEVI